MFNIKHKIYITLWLVIPSRMFSTNKMAFAYSTLIWFSIFALSINTQAAPGDLDSTFGNNGLVTTDLLSSIPNNQDFGEDIAIQTDGKIVFAGYTKNGSDNDFAIVRYKSDGSLDSSFGLNGKVITDFNSSEESCFALAIQTDGKIVAAGLAFNGADNDFIIARYNTDGSLDSSFDTDGWVINDLGSNETGVDLAIQADGKILIVGRTIDSVSNSRDFATVRYNTDGTLDSSFGSNGKVLTNITTDRFGSPSGDDGQTIAIQTDGKIVVAGNSNFDSEHYFAAVRYNPDGSLDTTFNDDGKVTTSIVVGEEFVHSIAIQTDGKIVVVGRSYPISGQGDFAIIRYNTDGTLDSSFDSDGIVTTDFGPNPRLAFDLGTTIQTDGKIIVVGSVNGDFTSVRYNSNGTLDNSFGTNGLVQTDFNLFPISPNDHARAVAIQSDGKIVVAGIAAVQGSSNDFALARYITNSNNSKSIFDFDGDSKTDISIFRPSLGEWWYLRSSDFGNGALQFGSFTDIPTPADFTGDGKTDIAFFRNGEWFVLRSEDDSFFSFPWGTTGDIPAPGDFDGDGKADPTVFRPNDTTWFILRSTDNNVDIIPFGIAEDKPVIADYDGDGKDDIAVYRPSVSEWWINQSTDGVTALQFGSAGDRTVQGDYTGDGKADIAFFRPTTGEWFIIRSDDSSFFSFPFGTSGDIPAPGDYDGDGTFDATVFRPSSTTWFINGTTSGVQIVGFGLNGDIPVPSVYSVP